MENHQNQESQQRASAARPAENKSSGGGKGGHGRGSRGGHHHRRPQQKKTAEEAVEQQGQSAAAAAAPVREEKADKPSAPKPQKSGERSRGGRNRNRGKGNGNQKDTEVQPQNESKRSGKDSGSIDSSMAAAFPSSSLFGSADFMSDSSFLPAHEEHKPDPEAEKYAAAILDAEGPLLFSDQPLSEAPDAVAAPEQEGEDNTPVEIVGIRFRPTGKVYFFDPGALKLRPGSYAVVETARGLEYGEVSRGNTTVPQKQIVLPLRPVIRAATAEDDQHYADNKAREDEAFRICQEKIASHGLDMKLVEAEYTFDNTKLLFYFTSAGRVDFRELVKDLAGVFRTRIELRQIGIRDEAKLLGGLGTCGRPLCCASFLADFVQVSIKMAKEQNLSLNSTKISGCCGRLMCCLRYESDTYEEEIRRTPSVGSLVQTPDGVGNVIANNPLRGTVRVRLGGEEGSIKEYHRDIVRLMKAVAAPQEE